MTHLSLPSPLSFSFSSPRHASGAPQQSEICRNIIKWCKAEKRTFLRQRVEAKLSFILYEQEKYGEALALVDALLVELKKLDDKQLLVVTHSPQVASKGDAHFLINKSSNGTVSRTDVAALDGEGRRQEIARMLSGADVTDEARAQADRLLEGV